MVTTQEHIDEITNNACMVDNQLINHLDIKNPFGQHWQRYSRLNIGVKDVRPRVGTFTTPWNTPNRDLWRMPDLYYIDDSLTDILDERAIELLNLAKNTNRDIHIMWSGGIDSSGVLVAFLKTMDREDREMLTVVMNTDSYLENPDFYRNHISNKLKIKYLNEIDVNNEFLSKSMLLHGDPGDCLYGPSIGAFAHLIPDGKHLLPANENRHLIKTFYDNQVGPWSHPDFGEWYVNKVADNFAEAGLENASTIADYWWWHYFNLKYQFSMQRPLQHLKGNYKEGLKPELYDRFIREVFFHTDRMQRWSYSNLHTFYEKIHLGDPGTKWQARDYLYDFDKNDRYYYHKVKISSQASDKERRMLDISPFYYDRYNMGHYPWEEGVTEAITYFLEEYTG